MSCLKQIYNITDDAANVNSTNRIGVAGFLNQFANIADLKTFYSRQLPQAVGSTFQTILVNGNCHDFSIGQYMNSQQILTLSP